MKNTITLHGPRKEQESLAPPSPPTIRWIEGMGIKEILATLSGSEVRYVHFDDAALFADPGECLRLCVMLRERKINILWSARLNGPFGGGRLRVMRMAGCRKIVAAVPDESLVEIRDRVRELGFDYVFLRPGGAVLESAQDEYTVAEREAIAVRLPGVHSAQFDLAVAHFRVGNIDKVMEPLGKAVALGFPGSDLGLHLMTCLKAALEYPEADFARFIRSAPDSPRPIFLRNRELMDGWLENRAHVTGARMVPDPATETFPFY